MGALSALTLMTGAVIPELAYAKPPGDMAKFTEIAREIEWHRRGFYNQMKAVLGGDVPDNVCKQNNLPAKARDICKDFDEKSRTILGKSQMPVGEFNALILYCRKSPKPQECPP